MANENPKALPNLFNSDKAIVDLRAAIREVDEHSIVALKDLTRAFNTQKRKLDALEREVKESDTNISDIEAAIEQNNSEIFTVQTIQNKILTQVGKLETLFSDETRKLERKIDDETGVLNKNFQDLSRKIEQSGGFSLTNIGSGLGAKAAKAAPAAEAAVSKRTLASIVPSLAKNAVRGIGGIIASFTTDIVSGVAEATGHPQIAAGADILGDTMVGASLGGMFGPLGAAVGGIVGAGYGAYDKGAQLLGSSEISPYIKDLQTQAEGRTAAREQERIQIEQLHQEKPELSRFTGGQAPEVYAPPSGPAAPTGQYTPSNAFFDSIIKAEGTAKHGNPYDTSLGYMRSPKPLTQMTLDESLAWGDQIRAAQGLNSSAKGAFQIVNTTQRAAMKALGLKGTDIFNEETQRKMAAWIVKTQGLGAWEGFKSHRDQRQIAEQAMSSGLHQQTAMPVTQPTSPTLTPSAVTPSSTTPEVGRTGQNPQMVNGATPMSQTPTTGGPPGNDIVGLGKWLQSQGITVSEHPSFGGVHPEQHHPGSAHNDGVAIDINAPGGIVEANDPVWGKKFDEIAKQLQAAGYTVLWRAKDHYNHIHAQIGGKGIKGGQSYIGGQPMGQPSPYGQQTQLPPQATQPTPQAPQITAPPMGAAMGSSGIAGMQAQLMGNPLMMAGGAIGAGGMAGMVANMVAPMLLNGMMNAQLQPSAPQTAELIMPNIGGAPIQPVDETGPDQGQSQVNNVNVMGSYEKGVSSATNQHQVAMNARPDWLGGLAEGLLGATYTGMSRPKYFGAGTGKM